MSSGSSGLRLRNHLAAGWVSGFSRGAIKPPANMPPKPQAIGRLLSSLIVLERHLWLTMTEMKEADKVPFLERSGLVRQPVWTSCGGLCGTLYGGSEVVSNNATILQKRTSSSAASPKPAPSQQSAKPTPTTPEPRPDKTRQDRGHSRSARCYPLPKCQGPQPKIALDPAPQKSS